MSNSILLGTPLLFDALPTDARRHLEGMTDAHSPKSSVSRLLIADDRSRTRRALRAVLSTQPEIELIGEAADGDETIAAVERLRPDVVILDIRMPRVDGIAATRHIKSRWPEI